MTASSFSCQSFERNFKDTEKEPVSQIFFMGIKTWNQAFFPSSSYFSKLTNQARNGDNKEQRSESIEII